jgi:hypothetical protein
MRVFQEQRFNPNRHTPVLPPLDGKFSRLKVAEGYAGGAEHHPLSDPSSQAVDFRRPLADSFKPATIEGMRASSDSTALVTVDPRRRIMRSVREGLVKLHGALIIAEQQTYERLNGPVPSVEALIDLLQKDPWFTWLHPIADVLVRMDHLLDDDTTDITDDNVAHLMGEVDALLHPSVQGEGFERAYYEALDRAPDVVLAHFQVRKLLPKAA